MDVGELLKIYSTKELELKFLALELKAALVKLYSEKEEITVGQVIENNDGVKGEVTRIEATTRGVIIVYWKKHKNDGTLYKYESEAYTTGKYMPF